MEIEGKFFGRSTFDESFSIGPFDTRHEAVNGTKVEKRLRKSDHFFTGQIKKWQPLIDSSDVFDQLVCEAESECGSDVIENWLSKVPKKEKQELDEALNKVFYDWMEKYGHQPQFGVVTKEQEHIVL